MILSNVESLGSDWPPSQFLQDCRVRSVWRGGGTALQVTVYIHINSSGSVDYTPPLRMEKSAKLQTSIDHSKD